MYGLRMPAFIAALLLTIPACGSGTNATRPTAQPSAQRSAQKEKPATSPPTRTDTDPAPVQPEPPENPLAKDALPLPDAPKLDAKNELKALNEEKTLFLELAPDPKEPSKKKPIRVLLVSEVCLREGPLEVLLCRKDTKEHEAILRTDLDARYIHAALIAAGGKPGTPVRFVNEKAEPDYRPASGTTIEVDVSYLRDGKQQTHPAQEWIIDLKTKKPMSYHWVFAGSRFMPHPDHPNDPPYYCANNGEFIAISNFIDSMLDIPVEITGDNEGLAFGADTKRIPPLLSKVWVILQPKPDSAEKPMKEKPKK